MTTNHVTRSLFLLLGVALFACKAPEVQIGWLTHGNLGQPRSAFGDLGEEETEGDGFSAFTKVGRFAYEGVPISRIRHEFTVDTLALVVLETPDFPSAEQLRSVLTKKHGEPRQTFSRPHGDRYIWEWTVQGTHLMLSCEHNSYPYSGKGHLSLTSSAADEIIRKKLGAR
jgi:hypothetical protein